MLTKLTLQPAHEGCHHEDHPIRPLSWVLCMFKTIHDKKCCVEFSSTLSHGAGEKIVTTKVIKEA